MDLALVYRTARHLRWSQMLWRLRFAWQRNLASWGLAGGVARLRSNAAAINAMSIEPMPTSSPNADLDGTELYEELKQGRLTCAGMPLPFNIQKPDWRLGPRQQQRLPAITLHYHRWIFELLSFAERSPEPLKTHAGRIAINCLEDWLDQCGRWNHLTAPLAWNSYAIATRMEWWARIFRLSVLHQANFKRLRGRLTRSLVEQAQHLYRSLEWDLRANHLFRDVVGLAWASQCVTDQKGRKWRAAALRIANEQLSEQILQDGVHFERSPMYHLEMMHDIQVLTDLLGDDEFRQRANEALDKMSSVLDWITHPDGFAPQWNDGKRSRPADHSSRRVGKPRQGGHWLGAAGWAVWRSKQWFVLFDAGAIGPDEQPGHGHADTLAVECSFQGQKLFVDPGNFDYDMGEGRSQERSTAEHNTVTCDNANSSEVWHIFRVGRRAAVKHTQVIVAKDSLDAAGEHDGFAHLPDQPIHRRRVQVGEHAALRIRDEVFSTNTTGAQVHDVAGGWLLEPGWEVETLAGGWRLTHPETEPLVVAVQGRGKLELSVQDASIAPSYHQRTPTKRLVWRCEGFLPLRVETTIESAVAQSLSPGENTLRFSGRETPTPSQTSADAPPQRRIA